MKLLLRSTTLCFALLLSIAALAQSTATGKVTDENGNPLVGATVKVRSTTTTTTTGVDGSFSIKVPSATAKIEVSYIGYANKVLTVGSGSLDIRLAEDNTKLNEVVVTGLATTVKRTNSANSVATISAKQLTGSTRPATLDGAMQGKLPGAQISANSGAPGGGFSVRLRGVSSINQSSEPLYIIDGVYVNNAQNQTGAGTGPFSGATGQTSGTQDQAPNRLADLNPADIENVEILKGSSAAAIYGTRANAGVIIITTKKGKAGKTQVSVGQDVGIVKALNLIGMHKTPWDLDKINKGIWLVPNSSMASLFAANGSGNQTTDYEKLVYGNTGVISNTRVSMSGGSDNAKFYAAAGHWNETGIQKRTGYRRTSLRLNADFKATKFWDVSFTSNYLNTSSDRSFAGNDNNGVSLGYNLAYLPNWLNQRPVNGVYPENPLTGQNVLEIVDKGVNNEKVNRFIGAVTSNLYLLRTEKNTLKFAFQSGLDFSQQENVVFMSPDIQYQQQRANPGASRFTSTRAFNTNMQGFLVYNLQLNKFNFITSAGLTRIEFNNRSQWFQGEGLPGGSNNPNNGLVQLSNLFNSRSRDDGRVIQQEVNWDDKVIANLGYRWDKSTANGDASKFYTSPKASLAINVANFDFWKIKAVSQFKLRVAYGQTQNPPNFGGIFTSMVPAAIGGGTGFVTPASLGNPIIKPETANELEFGADFGFLNNRFTAEFTYYDKKVNDFIDVFNLSPGTGVSSYAVYNVGDFKNNGYEVGVGGAIIRSKSFRWSTNINWWQNRTEITRMIIPEKPVAASGFGSFGTQRQRVGSSPTAWYGTPNVNGSPTKYEDAQPKWQLSWSNNIVFLNDFEFSFLLHHSHKNFNSSLNQELTDEGGTSPDWSTLDKNGVPVGVARQLGQTGITTRQFIQDATFTKLREVSLYYTLPKKLLDGGFLKGIQQIKVGLSGQNLFIWTDYYGYDPEAANFGNRPTIAPVDLLSFPSARRMYFHLNVNF